MPPTLGGAPAEPGRPSRDLPADGFPGAGQGDAVLDAALEGFGQESVGRLAEGLAVEVEGAPVHRDHQGGTDFLEDLSGLLRVQVVRVAGAVVAVAADR